MIVDDYADHGRCSFSSETSLFLFGPRQTSSEEYALEGKNKRRQAGTVSRICPDRWS